MLELIIAPKAEADLIDIWLYVAKDQPVNADRLLDRFNQAALLLTETPEIGIKRKDLGENLRSHPVGSYILYYRVTEDALELVRVLSASRDIDRLRW